jgi:hypothetical protein
MGMCFRAKLWPANKPTANGVEEVTDLSHIVHRVSLFGFVRNRTTVLPLSILLQLFSQSLSQQWSVTSLSFGVGFFAELLPSQILHVLFSRKDGSL